MLQSVQSDHPVQGHTLPVVSAIHDALLQSSPRLKKPLQKNDFFTFPRYSSYSMWVRWANLQSFNVKFLQDSVCQKWLKSVYFWRSYSKNKNERFLGHSVLIPETPENEIRELHPTASSSNTGYSWSRLHNWYSTLTHWQAMTSSIIVRMAHLTLVTNLRSSYMSFKPCLESVVYSNWCQT